MKLLETIESFRRTEHYNVDGDCWYSCPAHPDYCGPDKGCLCGFDEHNAKVDKAAAELTALTERVRVLEATLSYVERQMSDPQKGKFTALQVVRGVISPPAGPGDGG